MTDVHRVLERRTITPAIGRICAVPSLIALALLASPRMVSAVPGEAPTPGFGS